MRDIGAEHNAFGIAGAVLTPADGGGGYIPVPLATAIAITDEQRLALDYGGDSLYPQAAARRRSTSRARMTVDGASAELLSAAHGAVVEGKQAHGGYAEKINGDAPLQFTVTEAMSEFVDIVADVAAGGETTISLLTPTGLERFVLPWASLGYHRLGERLIIHRTQSEVPAAAVSGRWLASPTRSVISPPRAAGVKEWNVTAMTARGGVYDRQHILRMYRAVFDGGTRRLRDNATSDGAQEFGLTLLGYPSWELSLAAPAGDVAARAKTASRELFALVEGDNARDAANGWWVGVTQGPNLLSQNRPMQFNVGVDFASAFFGSAQELLAELSRPAESGRWFQAEISFKNTAGGGVLRWQFSRAAAEVRDNQLIITPPVDARSFTNAAAGWSANIPAGETGLDIYTSAQAITGDFRLWLVRAENAPAVLADVLAVVHNTAPEDDRANWSELVVPAWSASAAVPVNALRRVGNVLYRAIAQVSAPSSAYENIGVWNVGLATVASKMDYNINGLCGNTVPASGRIFTAADVGKTLRVTVAGNSNAAKNGSVTLVAANYNSFNNTVKCMWQGGNAALTALVAADLNIETETFNSGGGTITIEEQTDGANPAPADDAAHWQVVASPEWSGDAGYEQYAVVERNGAYYQSQAAIPAPQSDARR